MKNINLSLTESHFQLIKTIALLREILPDIKNGISSAYLSLLRKKLKPFTKFRTIEIFLKDCEKSVSGTLDFSETRDYVFDMKEPIVISVFKAPYNQSLVFDAMIYEIQQPDAHLAEKYRSSMANTINVKACTFGFDQYPTCVALFPENFVAGKKVKNEFSVFYFVNVFIRRFEEFGRPILKKYVSQKSFWRLKRLSQKVLLKSFATWFYLHEYHHGTGHLPLGDYFKVKNTKTTAAVEELRVDVLSILACLESAQAGYTDAYFYAELILFERLLRYSAHSFPEENYDARSSLMFLKFLEEQNAVSVDNNLVMHLQRHNLKHGLDQYASTVSGLEREIRERIDVPDQDIDYQMERKPLAKFAGRYIGEPHIKRHGFLQGIYDDAIANHFGAMRADVNT